MTPAIDIHFHAIPPHFVAAMRAGSLAGVVEIDRHEGNDNLLFHAPEGVAIEPGMVLRPGVYDDGLIADAMGRLRLDAAAVSVPPEFFMYWAAAETGERIARLVNDGYAEWARAFPARFLPLATVPMQDPARACRELRRAVGELGLRGVAICTHVNGVDLDDARFSPFYAAAEDLDVPVFLHPQSAGELRRLADFHLWNMVGFPIETATAAARLVLSGTLARHPRLKIVLAHGGGYFPYQVGRLDHGWRARAHLRTACPEPPSSYLGQLYCDSLLHDARALRFLVERMGADHVVLGTDYPFDMGSTTPTEDVLAGGFSAADTRLMRGETLAKLLKAG